MMRSLFLLFLLIPMALCAQKNLGKSRQVLMDHLQQFIKNSPSSKLEFDKQNERLVMSTRDSSGQSIRYEYGFDDKSGACFTEMTVSTCETCVRNELNWLLSVTSYQWKKINESQYVSRFEDYLLIEWQQTGTEFSFTLIKTAWTRELYNMMKEN